MGESRLAELREDLQMGTVMAVLLTVVAALPLAGIGVLNLLTRAAGDPLVVPWSAYGMFWLVIPGSYLVAGIVSALAFWALRPLRGWLLGYALTGAVVAVIVYGTIGLALAVFHEQIGRFLLQGSTAADAWETVRALPPLFAVLGAFAGVWQWFRGDSET